MAALPNSAIGMSIWQGNVEHRFWRTMLASSSGTLHKLVAGLLGAVSEIYNKLFFQKVNSLFINLTFVYFYVIMQPFAS